MYNNLIYIFKLTVFFSLSFGKLCLTNKFLEREKKIYIYIFVVNVCNAMVFLCIYISYDILILQTVFFQNNSCFEKKKKLISIIICRYSLLNNNNNNNNNNKIFSQSRNGGALNMLIIMLMMYIISYI